LVARLGVHDDATGILAAQPMKAVQQQPLPETLALGFGEYGETLDKAAPLRSSTDGVPDNLTPHAEDNPQPPLLGCSQRVSQARPVQAPKRGERRLVDIEQPLPAPPAGSVKRRAWRDRRERDVRVQDEEMEVLMDVEARLEETTLLVGREGGGDHALETLFGQQAQASPDELGGSPGTIRYRHEEGN
jgi:hypothetical protein